jgi:hypothetical protein
MKLSLALFLTMAPLASAQSCGEFSRRNQCVQNDGCAWERGTCVSTGPTCIPVATTNQQFGFSDTGGFDFALDLDVQPGKESAYINAKARWERIVTGDLPPSILPTTDAGNQCSGGFPTDGIVDDIYICGRDVCIDGPGKILGQAGPTYVRTPFPYTAIAGVMSFDQDDVASLPPAVFDSVILHEMGHVVSLRLFAICWCDTPSP